MNKRILLKPKKWYIASCIGFILFPIGILFAIFNSVIDYIYVPHKTKEILNSGTALLGASLFFFTTTFFMSINISMNPFIISWIYIGGIVQGLYTCIFYLIHAKRANKLEQLLIIITESHITNIDTISGILCTNQIATTKLINKAIKMKLLEGASIGADNREIIFEKSVWAHQLCICNTCGATIDVNFGQTLICEFCGGKLDVKQI